MSCGMDKCDWEEGEGNDARLVDSGPVPRVAATREADLQFVHDKIRHLPCSHDPHSRRPVHSPGGIVCWLQSRLAKEVAEPTPVGDNARLLFYTFSSALKS